MFRGSTHPPAGEHQRRVRAAGGSSVTLTTADFTCFYETVPPSALPWSPPASRRTHGRAAGRAEGRAPERARDPRWRSSAPSRTPVAAGASGA